jgi:hypothetical protein
MNFDPSSLIRALNIPNNHYSIQKKQPKHEQMRKFIEEHETSSIPSSLKSVHTLHFVSKTLANQLQMLRKNYGSILTSFMNEINLQNAKIRPELKMKNKNRTGTDKAS